MSRSKQSIVLVFAFLVATFLLLWVDIEETVEESHVEVISFTSAPHVEPTQRQHAAPPDQTTIPKKGSQPVDHRGEFGYWKMPNDSHLVSPTCQCDERCYESGQQHAQRLGSIDEWGPKALQSYLDDMVEVWKRQGGVTRDHLVSMVCCSYRTRTHYNPSGVWLHIANRTATPLRIMVDGYHRQKRILSYIKEVVAKSPRPIKPLVMYISTTDTPCHPFLPYVTFFLKRGVLGFMIPDDTFVGGAQKTWKVTRETTMEAAAAMPYASRNNSLYFRGSPTHPLRTNVSTTLKHCCKDRVDVELAVMERFKHLVKPLHEHTWYKFLLAIRGRTASSRDKYLNLLNSTILWAQDHHLDDRPWFQFYHALWKPFVNFVPLYVANAKCAIDFLISDVGQQHAERIAAASLDVGRFLTQERVDEHLLDVLSRYADLQQFDVDPDPIEFVQHFYGFVKRWYKNAQVMPDDRNPVKFMFYKWLKRRVRQMQACKENTTEIFSYHRQGGCWY